MTQQRMRNALMKWQIQSAQTQKIIIWPFIENIAKCTLDPRVQGTQGRQSNCFQVISQESVRQSVSEWVSESQVTWNRRIHAETWNWILAEQRWSFLFLSRFHKSECDDVNDENDWTGVWFVTLKFSLPVPSRYPNFSPSTQPVLSRIKKPLLVRPCLCPVLIATELTWWCQRGDMWSQTPKYRNSIERLGGLRTQIVTPWGQV